MFPNIPSTTEQTETNSNRRRKSEAPSYRKHLAIKRARQQKSLGQPILSDEKIATLYGEENIEIYKEVYLRPKRSSKNTYSKILLECNNETTSKRKEPEEMEGNADTQETIGKEKNEEYTENFPPKRQKSNPHPEMDERENFRSKFFKELPLELGFKLQKAPIHVESSIQPQIRPIPVEPDIQLIKRESFEDIVKSKTSAEISSYSADVSFGSESFNRR